MIRSKLLLLSAVLTLAASASTWAGSCPTSPIDGQYHAPTSGVATVDGDYSEWDLNNDFFANTYVAGSPDKDMLGNVYLRYDCVNHVVYVLALASAPSTYPVLASAVDAWSAIAGFNGKMYTGDSGNDGTAPDFA